MTTENTKCNQGRFQVLYNDEDIIMLQRNEHAKYEEWKLPAGKVFIAGCKSGYIEVGVKGKPMKLGPGEVVMFSSGQTIQNIESSKDFEGFSLGMSVTTMQSIFHRGRDIQHILLHLLDHPVIKISTDCMTLLQHYKSLLEQKLMYSDRRFMKQSVVCIICSLIYELFAEVEIDESILPSERLSQKDKLFRAFIEMLSSEKIVNRKLSYYAERLYVSPKYLSHVCRCVSGRTAVAWINQVVTESVRYDLECSDLTIKEIATKYDFPNLSFFGKYIKRQLGMPPTEYRRQKERRKM